MLETKTIVIIFIVFVIVCIGAYFAFFNKSSGDSGGGDDPSGGGGIKPGPPPPDTCGGKIKPTTKCDDGQKLICDKGKWRCQLKCESNNNPFPTTFSNCDNTDEIKCDENGKYYCKGSTYCQNGGILYQDGCHCPYHFKGIRCQCDSTPCGTGEMNSDNCSCSTCCDSSTSIDGKCTRYNGPKNKCEGDCEKEKGVHFVYDPKTGECICPKGFSLENGICKPIDCGPNGALDKNTNKCVCKPDWSGPLCDHKICGDHGHMGSDGKCSCDSGYAGSVCQFSRADCGGHGNPSVDQNDNLVCICDPDYTGTHCTCKISDEPQITDTDKCRGIYQTCDDSSGKWVRGQNPCDKIYQQYGSGTSQDWVNACSSLLLSPDQQQDKDTISCVSKTCPSGQPNCPPEFDVYKTCASPSVMNTCKSDGTCNYCVCTISNGVPSYSCQAPQPMSECGKIPPSGFCSDGSSPLPLSVGEGDSLSCLWACPGTVLPKDFALKELANVGNIKGTNAYWDNSTNTSVYPTMNMDACVSNPSNLENITPFASGYRSLGGQYGFIKDYGKETQQFIPGSNVPNNLIVYNYTNGKPLNDSNVVQTMIQDGYGCAKPSSYQSGTACKDDNGISRGKFVQDCADLNGNTLSCSDSKARIRYDTGSCKGNCNNYSSKAQGKDVTYKGNYCEYSDNDTCNANGVVDNNGNCVCNPGYVGATCLYNTNSCGSNGKVNPENGSCICNQNYKGKSCQYSNQTTCKGQGTVDDNGNCGPPWIVGEIFPRCLSLSNPNETDYTKLQCAQTINPSLFSTNCVQAGLSDTKPADYGCPIIPDSTTWTLYVGESCHSPETDTRDHNRCKSGAVMRRVDLNVGEDGLYNLCQSDDFTNLDPLKNIDKRGISNPRVSGIALVRQDKTFGDETYSIIANNGLQRDLGNIQYCAGDNCKAMLGYTIDDVCDYGGAHDRYHGLYTGASFDFRKQYPNV